MFYDRFVQLCEDKGVTPVDVRKKLEISQSTMASWKSRGLTPNANTIMALAKFFDVTPAYLMGNDMAKGPLHEHTREEMDAINALYTEYGFKYRFAEYDNDKPQTMQHWIVTAPDGTETTFTHAERLEYGGMLRDNLKPYAVFVHDAAVKEIKDKEQDE